MAFRLDPPQSMQSQIQRLAVDRIESALERLSKIDTSEPAGEIEAKSTSAAHVHAVRRRCKQVRALARLVRPALGDDFAPFNSAVRDAARALAPLRNAHVSEQLLQALDTAPTTEVDAHRLTDTANDLPAMVDTARQELRLARRLVENWQLPDGFAPLASGLERTYRRGQRGLATARLDPSDDNLHEWRKDVKDLWYQLRLIEPVAPSMIKPMIEQLDTLGEDLGHHHDISLLIDGLTQERHHVNEREPKHPGATPQAARALLDIQMAADRADDAQHQLGRAAGRIGATIYAESPSAFITRINAYWDITAHAGPEPDDPSTRRRL